jgi:hypothetical protein
MKNCLGRLVSIVVLDIMVDEKVKNSYNETIPVLKRGEERNS